MCVRDILVTAQHSTAQHSTAQHSTAQHICVYCRARKYINKAIYRYTPIR